MTDMEPTSTGTPPPPDYSDQGQALWHASQEATRRRYFNWDQKSVWENPRAVARYRNFVRSAPPQWAMPEWLNKDKLEEAYQYMKWRNNDKPPEEWGYLPESDPGVGYLRSMPQPPPQLAWPGEAGWNKRMGYNQPAATPSMDPFGDWNSLDPWQQVYLGLFAPQPGQAGLKGRPEWTNASAAGIQAMLAIPGGMAIGSMFGGPLGAAVGGGLAAGITAYQAFTGNQVPIFNDLLNVFNIGPMALEHIIGMGEQVGAEGLQEVMSDLPAAWSASNMTYETAQVDILNLWAKLAGDEHIANPDQVWQISKGIATPQALQGPRGAAALKEARDRLLKGDDPLQLYQEFTSRFGDTGTFNDFIAQTILDPSNAMAYGAAKGLGKVADIAGQKRLGLALSEGAGSGVIAALPPGLDAIVSKVTGLQGAEGLITSLDKYKDWIRRDYFPGDTTRVHASELSSFEKWAGGLTEAGTRKDLEPNLQANFLQKLNELTPAAKTHTFMTLAQEHLKDLFYLAKGDPGQLMKILDMAARQDPAEIGKSGMAILGSPEMATVAQALRDVLKDNWHQEKLLRWDETTDQRGALETIAKALNETGGQVLDDFKVNPEALLERIKTAGGPAVDLATLHKALDVFTGDDAAPWSAGQFQAELSNVIFDKMDGWLVQRYGLKPDPALFRMSGLLKSMQSIVLLNYNPGYFINNMVNNAATRMATGVFGYMTPRQIQGWLERFGLVPERLAEAIGPTGDAPISGGTQVRAALTSNDWIGKVHRTVSGFGNKLGLFNRLSNWGERVESSNAQVIGMQKFMGRAWKVDKGLRRMKPDIEAMLDREAPGLKETIYSIAEAGLNISEIEARLFGEAITPRLNEVINDVARQLFPDHPDAGVEYLRAEGIADRLESLLAEADTSEKVTAAVNKVKREITQRVNEAHKREVAHHAEDVANQVHAEGWGTALDIFNENQGRLERAAKTGDLQNWARAYEYSQQTIAGLLRAIGTDSKDARTLAKQLIANQRELGRLDQRIRRAMDELKRAGGPRADELRVQIEEWQRAYSVAAADRAGKMLEVVNKHKSGPRLAQSKQIPDDPRTIALKEVATKYGLVDETGRPVLRYLLNVVNRRRKPGEKYRDFSEVPLDEANEALAEHQANWTGHEAQAAAQLRMSAEEIIAIADSQAREAELRANGMLTRRLVAEQLQQVFEANDAEAQAVLALMDYHADTVAQRMKAAPNAATRDAWYATRIARIVRAGDDISDLTLQQSGQVGVTNYIGPNARDPVNRAMVTGMQLFNAGNMDGLEAVRWGVQQGINHLKDIVGEKAQDADVSFGKFQGSQEPTIYLRTDLTDADLPGFFYAMSAVGWRSFHQWGVLVSRRAPDGATLGPIEVNGLRGRVEPAVDITFDHPMTAAETARLDKLTAELGIPGYTIAPDGSRIEIMRVGLYNKDYEPHAYAQTLKDLADRLDSEGITGTPELYAREVYLANKTTTSAELGTYSYKNAGQWAAHVHPLEKRAVDQRLAERPYTPTKPPDNIKQILSQGAQQAALNVLFQESHGSLVAMHNLTPSDLVNADKLGALPVPSIAVVRHDLPLHDYGSISLIGKRDMVDPNQPSNRVFEADIWSPTKPRKEFGPTNYAEANKLVDRLGLIAMEVGDYKFSSWLDNVINQRQDYNAALSVLNRETAPKMAFLRDQGIDFKPAYRQRPDLSMTKYIERPEVRAWLDANYDALNHELRTHATPGPLHRELGDLIKKVVPDYEKDHIFAPNDLLTTHGIDNLTREYKITRDWEAEPPKIDSYWTDVQALKIINEKGLQDAYKTWAENLLRPVFGEPMLEIEGVRYPYTLENIVKKMVSERIRANEDALMQPSGVKAATAHEFTSIEDMHHLENKLVDTETFQRALEQQETVLKTYHDRIEPYAGYMDGPKIATNELRALALFLKERKGKYDEATMEWALNKMGFEEPSADAIDAAMEAAQTIQDTPTEYFEAKPQRAVNFDEFAGAVVPENAPPEIFEILNRRGVEVRTYVTAEERPEVTAEFYDQEGVLFQGSAEKKAHELSGPEARAKLQIVKDAGYLNWEAAAPIFEGGTPNYLRGVVRFILEQREKYNQGKMTASDVAKAYVITVSSQGSDGNQVDTVLKSFKKAGVKWERDGQPMDLTPYSYVDLDGVRKFRPEEITGAWFLTDQGRAALADLENGIISPEWQKFFQGRHVYGRLGNEPEASKEDKLYGRPYGTWMTEKGLRHKIGKKGQHLADSKFNLADIRDITREFNAAKGDSAKIHALMMKMAGVDIGKVGFVKHLLGFGDEMTVDTQEANFWGETLPLKERHPGGLQDAFEWGNWNKIRPELKEMVQTIFRQLRDEGGIGTDIPEETFMHVMHHWLWDHQKGTQTRHIGMYSGQRGEFYKEGLLYQNPQGAKGGVQFLRDGRAVIRAMEAPDVSTLVHEIGHIFRRDLDDAAMDTMAKLGGLHDGAQLRDLQDRFMRGEIVPGDAEYQTYVDAEENFARGWERYLAEGDAPTPELRGMFQQFTDWLLKIYDHLRTSLDKNMNRQVFGFERQADFQVGGHTVDIRATVDGRNLKDIFDKLLVEQRVDDPDLAPTPGGTRLPQSEAIGKASTDFLYGRMKELPQPVQEAMRTVAQQLMNELSASRVITTKYTVVEGGAEVEKYKREWEGPDWFRSIIEAARQQGQSGDDLKAQYMSALRSIAAGRDRANVDISGEMKALILERAVGSAEGIAGLESNVQPAILRYMGEDERLFQEYGDKILSSTQAQLEKLFGAEWESVVDDYLLWAADQEDAGGMPNMPETQTDIEGNQPQSEGQLFQSAPATPEFQNWFQDSKVTDEEGKALRVFHGTNRDFSQFDLGRSASTDTAGFYFTKNPEDAAMYASGWGPKGANVIPAYLKITNPATSETLRQVRAETGLSRYKDVEAFKQELIRRGYDGIITGSEYVAFEPTQIKSTFNQGTFNPNDANILLQARTETPEFRKWFRQSQVLDDNGEPLRVYHGTTHDFTTFDIKKTTADNYYGRGFYFTDTPEDVNANYAGIGPDLKSRIEQQAEEYMQTVNYEDRDQYDRAYAKARARAEKKLVGDASLGVVMPTYLRMENPIKIGTPDETRFTIDSAVDEAGDYTGEESGNGLALYDAILQAGDEYGFDGQAAWDKLSETVGDYWTEGVLASEIDSTLRMVDEVQYASEYNDSGEATPGEIMSYIYGAMGYDGIIMDAYKQFGPGRFKSGMPGLEPGSRHFIVWNKNQIKSTFNRGTWSDKSPNILYQGPSAADGVETRWQRARAALAKAWEARGPMAEGQLTDLYNENKHPWEYRNSKEWPLVYEYIEASRARRWLQREGRPFDVDQEKKLDEYRRAGLFQNAKPEGQGVPPGGMPTPEPFGSLLDEATSQQVFPLLDAVGKEYGKRLNDRPLSTGQLSEAARQEVHNYMKNVEQDLASTKYAAMRYGEQMRDAALLNYQRRYGFDQMLELVFPYQFWYTRTMMNWAKRMVDRPGWFAMYARLKKIQERNENNMPERLRGKMRMPAPWLPDWAGGGLWFDPIGKLFPPATFGQPMEEYTRNTDAVQKAAEKLLPDLVESNQITQEEAAAAQQHQGRGWDIAMAQATAEQGKDPNPSSLVGMMMSPSLWWDIGNKLLSGKPEKISPLPLTRTASALQTATQGTALEGLGQAAGLLAAPERAIRHSAGLSEFGEWGDYYISRALANMAADGDITAEQAKVAMIEKKGPTYQEAYRRVQYEQMLQVPGAALLNQAAKGAVINTLEALPTAIFGGSLFPTGELKLRGLADDFYRAMDARDQGDDEAVNKFFVDHPEYEARLALNTAPEDRLRQFLISELWDRYSALDKPNRKLATKLLGNDFSDAFLNTETRSYDSIKVETLARWNQALKGTVPDVAETAPAIEAPELPLELYPPQTVAGIESYQAERTQQFPNYYALQTGYYSIPEADKRGRRSFLARFPQLARYWDWNRQYKKNHPELADYWNENARTSTQPPLSDNELRQVDPVLVRQVLSWKMTGQTMTTGAASELARLAKARGLSVEDYATLIAQSLFAAR